MKIDIPYGKENIELIIPGKNIQDIISGDKNSTSCPDENTIIDQALNSPISSNKLSIIAKGKKNAVILASDITRPCPSYKFLPALTEELNMAGIKNKDIKIMFLLT